MRIYPSITCSLQLVTVIGEPIGDLMTADKVIRSQVHTRFEKHKHTITGFDHLIFILTPLWASPKSSKNSVLPINSYADETFMEHSRVTILCNLSSQEAAYFAFLSTQSELRKLRFLDSDWLKFETLPRKYRTLFPREFYQLP